MRNKLMRKWFILPVFGLLMAAMVLAGCTTTTTITEAGSTSVQPLAELLAEAYMKVNPDVQVTVSGGGSTTGVKSAAEGTVDIGAASRELKTEEESTVVKHLLCRDSIAIVVHPSNPVEGLTMEQVKDIFTGVITNWSEVGGPNADILVVAREEGSGTRGAFDEIVLDEEDTVATAILQPSNGAVRTAVTGDPNAIGYIGLGYLSSATKALKIDGVECNADNARTGKYPVVRPLYFLTKEEPKGEVKKFIDFCTSEAAQAIVEYEGFISVY